ncbi:3-phosphoshikimate 1-carboxyvinyltransferase [Thiospirillum jenense]|uniref:3-phosphoshikimate 1-carboxyvinyltransferase n=1 Tax=Thiospirillum jenense TaxID=1653858 RepID=A0A839HDZ7_9GAMM|nr:3-phosphoshikimate 1-carboxyvinyltransferase [Thiospirillum jenense]MBB1125606.1 3-phosphoshikimate 1-carboxyvinyltransferase [Thiospirillum jenense]
MRFLLNPGGNLRGSVRVPGDKSISHRAIMLGALADGVTGVTGFLSGADSLATLAACRAMGVAITDPDAAGRVTIHGGGLHGLTAPSAPLDLGNSGTSMRLLAGLLAGQPFASTLIGDASLMQRPMRRVTQPLGLMGAQITASASGTAPLQITPVDQLRGIEYALPVASAQVKSSILLAGLFADGATWVTEPAPSRDHTERMLTAFGYTVERDGMRVGVRGGGRLVATDVAIPADLSSAAFFLVGASIAPESDLILTDVGINPTRRGIITLLQMMGADIEIVNPRTFGGEPVADLRVRSAALHGIEIPEEQVALAIDEFPALFIAAACAEGETVLRGAAELRVKESDRIQVMADGLTALGIAADPAADGLRIRGGQLRGGTVNSHGDHRVAMAFAMAALRASEPITILDCANVATSFPDFAPLAAAAGLRISSDDNG